MEWADLDWAVQGGLWLPKLEATSHQPGRNEWGKKMGKQYTFRFEENLETLFGRVKRTKKD